MELEEHKNEIKNGRFMHKTERTGASSKEAGS